jgi:hypothetical protein
VGTIAAEAVPVEAVESSAADEIDGRRIALLMLVVEAVWLSAIGYAISLLAS